MINVIKESIRNKTVIPANTIIGIDDIMEKKKMLHGKKKSALFWIFAETHVGQILLFLLVGWMAVRFSISLLWVFAIVLFLEVLEPLISRVIQKRDPVLICPNCDSDFKPPLRKMFFSFTILNFSGTSFNHWQQLHRMTCPECGHRDWCILRKPDNLQTGEM